VTTLADLIAAKTQQQTFDELLTALRSVGFPTTSWHTMGVPRRILWATAGLLASTRTLIGEIAKGSLLGQATGDWLTLFAESQYQEPRTAARSAWVTCTMYAPTGIGPYTIAAGSIWLTTESGKRFRNITGGTLSPVGYFEAVYEAEYTGAAYNVGDGEITILSTSLPGVTYPPHTAVKSTGTTPPTLTITGTAASEYDFDLEITTGGAVGAALFRWRANGGAWTTGVTTSTSPPCALGGTGVSVSFAAGTYATDNVYAWTSGATSFNPTPDCIVQVGLDAQSDEALEAVLAGKWATLAYGQNDDWYVYWSQHEPDYGPTITRVLVESNPGTPPGTNIVLLTLATADGAPSAAAVTAINSWMQAKKGNCITLTVAGATETSINLTATLYVRTGTATEAEAVAAATASVEAHLSSLGISTTANPVLVYQDQIKDSLIYDSSAIRNLTLTAPASDTTLSDKCVPVLGTVALTVVFV
jgi:hypothetical protein